MLRLALLIATAVVVVDWLTGSVVSPLPADDSLRATVAFVDLVANVALFFLGGYLGFRHGGVVRAGAEVGVIAGALAGVAAAVRMLLSPPVGAPQPGSTELVGLLALNVALGGLVGLAGAWFARARA